MKSRLAPIKLDSYQPLRELVCEHIRQAIIDGTFTRGERLMEIQLAEQMGVSRTPVREAIRKLELEGFVVMIPRRGTYVADISIKDLNEVYEIRTALDVLAAGLAAERINDDELEQMQRLLVEIGQYIELGDMKKIVEIDSAFHDILYQASRNERLVSIISNLREQFTGLRGQSMNYPGRLPRTLDEHRAIVDSISQRDVQKAQEAVRVHLENAEKTLLQAIEEGHKDQDINAD